MVRHVDIQWYGLQPLELRVQSFGRRLGSGDVRVCDSKLAHPMSYE